MSCLAEVLAYEFGGSASVGDCSCLAEINGATTAEDYVGGYCDTPLLLSNQTLMP